jgi:hypothetical protein
MLPILTEELQAKPIKEWSSDEVNYVLSQIEFEAEQILKVNSYWKHYMAEKRRVIQPIVNKIYDEIFASFDKKVTVWVERSEYDYIRNWAENEYVPYKKKTDYGYMGGDTGKAVERLTTGTCGNLAVIKYYGGSINDLDLTVGQSSKYNVPDLKQFLGGVDVGVKTARTGSYANLPLVLNYSGFTEEYINMPRNRNKKVEAQFFVGQNESNELKYYMIGVASPRVLIEGVHRAFTLDPKAMSEKKAGGGKGGFYAMYKTVLCDTKEELIELFKQAEYRAMPYGEI